MIRILLKIHPLIGIIRDKIFGINKQKTPKIIGEYHLVDGKSVNSKKYGIGIYEKLNRKYLIKTYQKTSIFTYDYLDLLNEYRNYKHICNYFDNKSKIKIPTLFEIIEKNQSISLVFEYINGIPLQSKSADIQLQTTKEILKFLQQLPVDNKNIKTKKSKLEYLIESLTLCIIACIKYPSKFIKIQKIFIDSIIEIINLVPKYAITHRDLNINNVMLFKKRIYLLDLSSLVVTYANYDATLFYLNSKNSLILKSDKKLYFKNSINKNLLAYIKLLLISFGTNQENASLLHNL